MVLNLLRPFSFLIGFGALFFIALAGPAQSEGYGDPAIVQEGEAAGGATEAAPGAPFSVSFQSNVECAWSSEFNGDNGPASVGFDYAATFTAPTEPGTYTGTVDCRYSTAGPFRPVAYSADATYAAGRDQLTSQTFTVVVAGDAGDDDTAGAGDDNAAGDAGNGALADTGGTNVEFLALGAGLLVVGGAVAIAARRRKSA